MGINARTIWMIVLNSGISWLKPANLCNSRCRDTPSFLSSSHAPELMQSLIPYGSYDSKDEGKAKPSDDSNEFLPLYGETSLMGIP